MDKFVKHVFTFLMWVTIAWIAYLVLFGTYSFGGRNLATGDTAYTGNTTQTNRWKGVLWHGALAVEGPISKYYYEFCYLPNIHAGDYVDEALGGSVNGSTFAGGDIYSTTTDLSGESDMYDFGGAGSYSTGWR